MVPLVKEVLYISAFDSKGPFFMAADIGGTNSNFGVFTLAQSVPLLLISLHYKSNQITNFPLFTQQVIQYIKQHYGITITSGCIGAAGIVYPHRIYVHPTNLSISINLNDVTQATGVIQWLLINDFEAVALGLELLDPKSIITINRGTRRVHANKAFIGAGTGLGTSNFVWDIVANRYLPVCSEAGHADAVTYTMYDLKLISLIEQLYAFRPVSWEHILSGAGIQRIYKFLGQQKNYPVTDASQEIAAKDFDPDKISYYSHQDERCRDTFLLYAQYYARFAKNIALTMLSLNGMYIAGGIAAKNSELFFDSAFLSEFKLNNKHHERLEQMPLYLIADYNVSLYGAVVAAELHQRQLL